MRFLLVALASLVLLAPPAPPRAAAAQELSARQQEYMKEYKDLLDLQDFRAINRMVARDPRIADEVLTQYCFKFVLLKQENALDEVAALAAAADAAEQDGTRFAKRMARLKAWDADGRQAWLDAWNAWVRGATVFNEALQKREADDFRRSVVALTEALELAGKAGDKEIASLARYQLGLAHENLGEYLETVKAYDVAMDEWKEAGRPKEAMYQHMVDKRRELIEKGFDPFETGRAEGPGSAPKRNSTTSYKEGSDWQEWTTEYKEMKEPAQIPSTSPWGCDHILLWREFGWTEAGGPHPFGALVACKPFDQPLMVVKSGAKGFFDLDGSGGESKGDFQLKVIDGKPSLNSLSNGEGRDAERHAWFMVSGGAGQNWFDSTANFSTRAYYRTACYRQGEIHGQTVLLIDDNCTGMLGDPSEQGDNILRGYPRWIDTDGIVIGKGKPQPWSDVLPIAGKWWHMKPVDLRCSKVRTRELDIATGQAVLKWNGPVPPKMLVVGETKEFKGCYFDIAGGKPVTLPIGRWEIAYGRIETGKAAQTRQAWIFKGESPAFEVKEGETTTVELGAPYTVTFATSSSEDSVVVKGKSLLIHDRSGAIVGRIYDEVPFFDVAARHAGGGSSIGRPKAMARITTELFNEDSTAAWFPADFTVAKPKSAEVEVQLTLKKHALLGGPITSEWK